MQDSKNNEVFPPLLYIVLMAGITFIGAVLRLWRLSDGDLWFDERFSAHVISLPWKEFFRTLWVDVHPPLYFILLKFWSGIFGAGVNSLRGFSFFAGMACIIFAGLLVRKIVGIRLALCIMLSLAVSPVLIHFSHEARMYSLLNALSLFQIALLWYLMKFDDRPWIWILWALISFCCLQIHHLYSFIILGECLWLISLFIRARIRQREKTDHFKTAMTHPLRALLILICIEAISLFSILSQVKTSGERLQWMSIPDWKDLFLGLFQPYIWGVGPSIKNIFVIILAAGFAGLFVYGLILSRGEKRQIGFFLLFLYVFFMCATFVISRFFIRCYHIQRFPVIAIPFLTIACAMGLYQLNPRFMKTVLLVLFWGINVYSLRGNCLHPERPRLEPLVNTVRIKYPDLKFILYDSRKERFFHKRYFPEIEFYTMDSLLSDSFYRVDSPVIYVHESTIWPENPDLEMFNPLLMKRCSKRMDTLAIAKPYFAYVLEGLDVAKLRAEWKNRIYLGRTETLGRPWLAFIGAEDGSLNSNPSFKLFQFNLELGMSYRWTKKEDADFIFVCDPPVSPGPKKIHICLSVDPNLSSPSDVFRFQVHSDGRLLEKGELKPLSGKMEYIIPFELPFQSGVIDLRTSFPVKSSYSLRVGESDVPYVGYLFFWAGMLDNK